MRAYRDFTQQLAVGLAQKEWREMAKAAVQIREGRASAAYAERMLPLFTGIFRRLLNDPIDEVKKEANFKQN